MIMVNLYYKSFIKMNLLVYAISTILISFVTGGSHLKEPNPFPFMCYYFGSTFATCNDKDVPVANLPDECTSLIFDGIEIDRKVVNDSSNDSSPLPPQQAGSPDDFDYLNAVLKGKKPVLVVFYHAEDEQWKYDTDNMTMWAKLDAGFVTYFLNVYPKVHGLIFNDVNYTNYKDDFPVFAERFQVYLHYIRNVTAGFYIGLKVPAKFMIDEFTDGKSELKFSTFDMEINFYMFTFAIFNPCTRAFRKGGVVPYDSNDSHIFTLKKLAVAIQNSGIPPRKVYFKFQLFGISNRTSTLSYYDECFTSYEKMCQYPNVTEGWCADTAISLRQKGAFAKDMGGGFIVDSIDLNDAGNRCHCKSPFPSFYYLLDGWNKAETYPECPEFDRTSIPP